MSEECKGCTAECNSDCESHPDNEKSLLEKPHELSRIKIGRAHV